MSREDRTLTGMVVLEAIRHSASYNAEIMRTHYEAKLGRRLRKAEVERIVDFLEKPKRAK